MTHIRIGVHEDVWTHLYVYVDMHVYNHTHTGLRIIIIY